ncbi:hypothetical protein [Bauldia sp.]|uniref:hypothetical protein n=1 Tax=Bauldia sp. TaxID=2575872 RepID=UPI003BAA5B51
MADGIRGSVVYPGLLELTELFRVLHSRAGEPSRDVIKQRRVRPGGQRAQHAPNRDGFRDASRSSGALELRHRPDGTGGPTDAASFANHYRPLGARHPPGAHLMTDLLLGGWLAPNVNNPAFDGYQEALFRRLVT